MKEKPNQQGNKIPVNSHFLVGFISQELAMFCFLQTCRPCKITNLQVLAKKTLKTSKLSEISGGFSEELLSQG